MDLIIFAGMFVFLFTLIPLGLYLLIRFIVSASGGGQYRFNSTGPRPVSHSPKPVERSSVPVQPSRRVCGTCSGSGLFGTCSQCQGGWVRGYNGAPESCHAGCSHGRTTCRNCGGTGTTTYW